MGLLARAIRSKVVRPATFAFRGFEVVHVGVAKSNYGCRGCGQVGRNCGHDSFRFANFRFFAWRLQYASCRRAASGCYCGGRYVMIRPSRASAAGPDVGLRVRRFRRAKRERDKIVRAVSEAVKDRHDHGAPGDYYADSRASFFTFRYAVVLHGTRFVSAQVPPRFLTSVGTSTCRVDGGRSSRCTVSRFLPTNVGSRYGRRYRQSGRSKPTFHRVNGVDQIFRQVEKICAGVAAAVYARLFG